MSRMSQLHAELSEQASRLGFQSVEEAEDNGYGIDYEKRMLVDGRELAHNDYLKRKEGILLDLETLKNNVNTTLDRAINFIKEGEI